MSDAIALESQAEKLIKKFWASNQDYCEAADLLERASHKYRMLKQFDKSYTCLSKRADLLAKIGDLYSAATAYCEAAKSVSFYLKNNNSPSLFGDDTPVSLYSKALKLFVEQGKFNEAARLAKDIAQWYEEEAQKAQQAEQNSLYKQALGYYEQCETFEQVKSNASTIEATKLKIAQLHVLLQNYKAAAKIYKELMSGVCANNVVAGHGRKYNSKKYIDGYMLCSLACFENFEEDDDTFDFLREKLDECRAYDLYFEDSDQHHFYDQLLQSIEKGKVKEFQQLCKNYNGKSNMDEFMVQMLLQVKSKIKVITSEDVMKSLV